ncbi:MAG: SgcJ/EcaC family oxidoreductase [Pseudomonadota bacterium]
MARLFALIFTVLTAPAFALADGHLPEEKIAASAAQWSAFYANRDLEGMMALYHEDAMLFTNGAPALVGRETIRAYFAKSFETTTGGEIDFKIESIRIFGDIAHLVSLYKMEIDAGKKAPITVTGRSMLVYKRDPFGHWLLFADMDNQAPDATVQAFDAAD